MAAPFISPLGPIQATAAELFGEVDAGIVSLSSDDDPMADQSTIHLEVSETGGSSTRLRVPGPRALIGRAPDAQVRLDRATVSRRHAELHCDPFGRWWMRDMGSRNRTLVNGEAVSEKILHSGDVLSVGEFHVKVLSLERGASLSGAGAYDPNMTMAGVAAPAVPVAAIERESISSLKEIASPRIAAQHVSDLGDFGQQLTRVEDACERLAMLCRLLVRSDFRGRCAMALRMDKSAPTPRPTALCEPAMGEGWKHWSPHVSQTVLRSILQREEPLLAGNTAASPDRAADISLAPSLMPLSAVACPIRSDESTLDLLYVVLPPEYGTGEWLALAALAVRQHQQAEAVWHARREHESHAAIERELEQARHIQARLVPKPLTMPGLDVAVGFRPCRWVGGDYVDVIRTAAGGVLMTLADVCGKGLPAAMVASGLHTTIRLAARAGFDLKGLVKNLNEHLQEALPVGSFVTMACALIDPATGSFQCVNAGHPAALLLSADGEIQSCQCSTNLPLGISDDAMEFEDGRLHPGQMLFLYSDGLIDLMDPDGKRLGTEGLRDAIRGIYLKHQGRSAQEMAAEVSRMLDGLEAGAAFADDRTFLVAKRS